jgi:glycosyltransferase involved in cell wall biosynthesis
VVQAVELLRKRNYDLGLTLVGGGTGKPLRLLNEQIARSDPGRTWVKQFEFLPHKVIQKLYEQTDVFVFASGCEAFGITLLEGMAAGLPIACSNRSCLPELLKDGGVYFDPENADSIASACETLLSDEAVRERVAMRAKELSEHYSWTRCADELFRFITGSYQAFAESGSNE